jgi:hypothetical protein
MKVLHDLRIERSLGGQVMSYVRAARHLCIQVRSRLVLFKSQVFVERSLQQMASCRTACRLLGVYFRDRFLDKACHPERLFKHCDMAGRQNDRHRIHFLRFLGLQSGCDHAVVG